MSEVLNDLKDLANELDNNNCTKLADNITQFMVKFAGTEVEMVHSQMQKIKDAMEVISAALGNKDEDLPAWVQSMISVAADDIDSVAHYMKTASKKKNVKLNKPFRTPGGPKKFSVYVKNDKGNIVKVNFGDPERSIKRDNPERRKNFRARHNCDSDPRAKDKTTPKFWSCKFWSNPSVTSLLKGK